MKITFLAICKEKIVQYSKPVLTINIGCYAGKDIKFLVSFWVASALPESWDTWFNLMAHDNLLYNNQEKGS